MGLFVFHSRFRVRLHPARRTCSFSLQYNGLPEFSGLVHNPPVQSPLSVVLPSLAASSPCSDIKIAEVRKHGNTQKRSVPSALPRFRVQCCSTRPFNSPCPLSSPLRSSPMKRAVRCYQAAPQMPFRVSHSQSLQSSLAGSSTLTVSAKPSSEGGISPRSTNALR